MSSFNGAFMRALLSGSPVDLVRWVMELNGMSYGVIPDAEFTDDFTIIIRTKPTLTKAHILSHTNASVRVFYEPGKLEISAYGTALGTFDYSEPLVGQYVVFTIARVNGVLTCAVNATQLTQRGSGSPSIPFTINSLGGVWGSTTSVPEFAGDVYSIEATGITNTDVYHSGTFNYKLDKPYSDDHIAVDSDNPDGDELVDNDNPNIVGTQWTYLGDGRWEYIGDGTFNQIELVGSSLQPDFMKLSFSVESINGTLACVQAGGMSVSSVGDYVFLVTKSVAISQVFKRGVGGEVFSCIISNVSITQTTAMEKFNDLQPDYTKEKV